MRGLQCAETDGDLRRDIHISDGEEDHVGEGVESAEAAGAILDDLDDAVDARKCDPQLISTNRPFVSE